MTVLVNLVVLLGLLVVLPAGLRMVDGLAGVRRYWLVGAVPGAVSLWLPRGPLATGLAAGYAALTVALALHAPLRLARRRSLAPREIAVLTALVAPSVAASALVAERAGYRLFGFELEILALTVPHLHYAGFVAALVAGLVCRAAADAPLARAAALSVPVGTGVVLAGYFVGDAVELAGAAVLTAGMWLVAWLTWRDLRPRAADRPTRWLLAVSSLTLPVTMLLALDWAAGHALGVPHLPLSWMVATHGLCNAVGFAVCALLAWRRMAVRSEAVPWVS